MVSIKEIYDGTLVWLTPMAEKTYQLIFDQRMILTSLNYRVIESLLAYNGLTTYLKNIGQLLTYKSELAQLYVNLKYEREGSPLRHPWLMESS